MYCFKYLILIGHSLKIVELIIYSKTKKFIKSEVFKKKEEKGV